MLKQPTKNQDTIKSETPIQIKGILTQANAEQRDIYLQNPDNQQIYLTHVVVSIGE